MSTVYLRIIYTSNITISDIVSAIISSLKQLFIIYYILKQFGISMHLSHYNIAL